jgi:epoxyqueuosine reductase
VEHKGAIPAHIRKVIGGHAFGCDRCQESCPANQKVHTALVQELSPFQNLQNADARALQKMAGDDFSRYFGLTPIRRKGESGFLKNLEIVINNM